VLISGVPRVRNGGAIIPLLVGLLFAAQGARAQEPTALFKTGVSRVALAAVVRDGKGKLVTDLTARDFDLMDAGIHTPLIGVWSEPSPASVALLLDVSGSMATKLERAREASRYLMGGLLPGVDEAALYSFDTELKEVRPFSTDLQSVGEAWSATRAYGATSLWDAIAETASRISSRQRRRALVVVTDGVDSASHLKPAEVSAIASSLDVPVYIVVISHSMEDEIRDPTPVRGPLADLAAWTGGDLLVIRDTASAVTVTRQILMELQHQYMVAFEPGRVPGWHELVLRTKKNGLFVRARSGYMVGSLDK
jgi:Ca-activated chloride channel family protein